MNPDSARTALVTGANGDLGMPLAARLCEEGFGVVVAARAKDTAAAVADELTARYGGSVRPAVIDVTDPGTIEAALAAIGPVHVLVNNAGVLLTPGRRPSDADLALVERELAVNTLGAWRMAQAVLPGMFRRGWGRIVNVSSGTASFTYGLFPGTPGYTVSKAALNAITVILARDTEGTGVLVNAVNPGRVRSRMCPDAQRTPQDAARSVVALATLADDGPTGAFFRPDGEIMTW
ncbi:SDR family NAD(P)-dependent oxidoreductase [Nonomuraea sp. NPDC050643]|uniref:SDR family NAD(P)-dependent oxidoreductase n=1 Tax=Nonomuraea sp. NPDC050643 TaxID=3155660 RepID=UPI0033C6412F